MGFREGGRSNGGTALIEVLERCTMLHVVNAELRQKYLSSQKKEDQYIVKIAT